jgi:hypothetical protein
MARYTVVIPRQDGGVEVHPLKAWLRQHPEILPGFDVNSNNTYSARDALLRAGWTKQETPTEVRLIMPGTDLGSQVVSEVLGSGELLDEADADAATPGFTLEAQLRDFIASNLPTISINGSHLRLYEDLTGREGAEFPSAVGPIDILAVDDNGSFFVFELKRANSPDKAMGQVQRYMGWVQATIGKEREVFGVIVAKSISENLRYAASVAPKVHLFEYEVNFQLKRAHDLTPASR